MIGSNGTGKTTLLRLIRGELTPTAGSVSTTGRTGYLLQQLNPDTGASVADLSGVLLGGAALLLVGLVWQDWRFATAIALLLPWVIDRLGGDPAFGSGPLTTVIQGILTVTIYLMLASLLVG